MSTIEEFEETWLRCAQEAKVLADAALSGRRYERSAGEQLQHLSSALPIEERFELLDLAQGKQKQSREAYWRMVQLGDRSNAPEVG